MKLDIVDDLDGSRKSVMMYNEEENYIHFYSNASFGIRIGIATIVALISELELLVTRMKEVENAKAERTKRNSKTEVSQVSES